MKSFLSKVIVGLVFLVPLAAQPQARSQGQPQAQTNGKQSKMIQLVLETDVNGNASPMLVDSNGTKMPLTLGVLMNAVAEAWMMGASNTPASVPRDPNAIAMIKVEKGAQGIKTYLVGVKNQYDPTGRMEPLNLGNLISASAVAHPGCTADQINGQTVNLKLAFAKDKNGKIQTYFVGDKGNEDFNLGTLIKSTTLLLNQCEAGEHQQ